MNLKVMILKEPAIFSTLMRAFLKRVLGEKKLLFQVLNMSNGNSFNNGSFTEWIIIIIIYILKNGIYIMSSTVIISWQSKSNGLFYVTYKLTIMHTRI